MEYKNYAIQKIEHIEIIKKVLNSILNSILVLTDKVLTDKVF
jgi:hypothetical protein